MISGSLGSVEKKGEPEGATLNELAEKYGL
jgi:hypothetical protein